MCEQCTPNDDLIIPRITSVDPTIDLYDRPSCGDPIPGFKIRAQLENMVKYFCYTSLVEPMNVKKTLKDEDWICVMQD